MNYYPFHVGDYVTHTAHLSPLEDIAYRRLLDLCYITEAPLPVDVAACARLIRMRDNEAEIAQVLKEFFVQTDDGWENSRCNREIEVARRRAAAFAELRLRGYHAHREFVLDRDAHTCVYCGVSGVSLQLDHVIPRSRGGADTPDNLVACCKSCNSSKGARTPDEWRAGS